MIHSENPGGRTNPPWRRVSAKRAFAAAAALVAFTLAGCSMTFPSRSLLPDDATGSVRAKPSPISDDLDADDWRVAEPKLAQALKSDGADETSWSNPDSGRGGAFQPVAGPFSRDGHFCRAFVARVDLVDRKTTVQAVGCLMASDEVLVDQVQPWKAL
jgi:hypothetical protein